MKKQLSKLLFLVVLMGLMTYQTGCKKDETQGKETLNGTVWKGTDTGDGWSEELSIIFQETAFTMIVSYDYGYGAIDTNSSTGTYVYNPPDFTLQVSYDWGYIGINGTIAGTTMILYIYGEDAPILLTKQS